MRYTLVFIAALSVCGCSTSGVDTEKTAEIPVKSDNTGISTAEKLLEPKKTITEKKEFPNGLKIQWFEKGTGESLTEGEVYEINYKVKLTDGEIVDGNHLLKRDMIPFLVGYGLQTTGWDMAMTELKVGDFVELYIPANLARGTTGVPGVIPPNSPNIVFLRIGKKIVPDRVIDGTKVWILEEKAENNSSLIGTTSKVSLHFFVGTKSNPKYDNSYKRDAPFNFHMDDFGLVPGFRKALINAKLYDKLWVLVPANEAYGNKGYLDLVKPNESVFYDVLIMDVI